MLYPETKRDKMIGEINILSQNLESDFKNKFKVTPVINRKMVSYQANKDRQQYRWYKYKEAFSATLVEYLLTEYKKEIKGTIIDPFAGSGTSIFASSELGYSAVGIELLPIGIEVIKTRLNLQKGLSDKELERL
ncbi:MAG: DNA methyltransferase, partial [Microcystaceae cyanobacterium]